MYPFDKRLLLYICPCIIIISSFGFNSILNKLLSIFKIKRFIPLAIAVPALMLCYFYRNGFPQKLEEIKKSINYIEQNKSTDDKIYMYYCACYQFEYYGKIKYFETTGTVIQGTNNRSEREKYIAEIIKLKGRNWLLFSHDYEDEETYIVRQLDSMGYKRLASFTTTGSSTYLYDFRN
jgi:AAA+ ATPase superfamily predicted ATPase